MQYESRKCSSNFTRSSLVDVYAIKIKCDSDRLFSRTDWGIIIIVPTNRFSECTAEFAIAMAYTADSAVCLAFTILLDIIANAIEEFSN